MKNTKFKAGERILFNTERGTIFKLFRTGALGVVMDFGYSTKIIDPKNCRRLVKKKKRRVVWFVETPTKSIWDFFFEEPKFYGQEKGYKLIKFVEVKK